jgi:CCR4-NOT transcription complex subunit 9
MDESNLKDITQEEDKEGKVSSSQDEVSKIIEWVNALKDESSREMALSELSKKRESFNDLAIYIWYSSGIVSCL